MGEDKKPSNFKPINYGRIGFKIINYRGIVLTEIGAGETWQPGADLSIN